MLHKQLEMSLQKIIIGNIKKLNKRVSAHCIST